MTNDRKYVRANNNSYQRQIAESMVRSMGIDAAIDACCRNDWTGTLNIIIKDHRLAQ